MISHRYAPSTQCQAALLLVKATKFDYRDRGTWSTKTGADMGFRDAQNLGKVTGK